MAIELGKAYVQIIPSAEGIKKILENELGIDVDQAGKSLGQQMGSRMVKAITGVLSTAAIGKAISASVMQGSALEQSIGGIETLFKDCAGVVKANAAEAYRTTGLSANAYMEQTTSFAASLLSSLGNNTKAAATVADMAMTDMADNANKMGTDMQDIQNAYQGFAKQNYTMLDNLKLGYGGTQAEMSRLLKDAEAVSGIHYELGNLSDMYNAIHVIQGELDITGTTAKEAATTLSGSFQSMKAAAENVLGNLSLGEDLQPSLEALEETAKTFLVDNFLPAVGRVISGIPQTVSSLLPDFLQCGTELMQSLSSGFLTGIPKFLSNALPQLLAFTEDLRANFGEFVSAGIDLILSLANGIVEGLPELFDSIPDIVINIAGLINDNAPKLLAGGVALVGALARGVWQCIQLIPSHFQKIVDAALSVISAVNWVNIGVSIVQGLANGIKSMAGAVTNAFKQGISGGLKWLATLPSQLFDLAKNALQSFINGLTGKSGIAAVSTAAVELTPHTVKVSHLTPEDEDIADKNEYNSMVMSNVSSKAAAAALSKAATQGRSASSASHSTGSSSTASKTETVISSVSHIATTTAQNELGTVENSITSLVEKVKDASGSIRDRLTETRTETGKELVDGIATTYKLVETKVDGNVTKTVKTYEDMSKVLSGTLTTVAESTFNGITTNVQKAVETYADGSKHIKETQTETGTRIVDGAEQTYTKVITFVDGIQDKVTETANLIDKSIKGTQTRIDQYLSDAKSKWSDGIFGTLQSTVSDLKNGNWSSLALDVTKLIWGEVSQSQREVLSKWASDSLDVINEAYAGNGLKGAYSTLQQLFADGVTATEGGSTTSVKGLQSLFQNLNVSGNTGEQLAEITEQGGRAAMSVGSFKASLDALNASGSVTSKLSGIAGDFSGMSSSIVSSLGSIVSVISANPILAAILGITAFAGGVGIAAWSRSKTSGNNYQSRYESPFHKTEVYDSLSEFSFRTNQAASQSSSAEVQTRILQRISDSLDKHLPALAAGSEGITPNELYEMLRRPLTEGIDRELGERALRKSRGG